VTITEQAADPETITGQLALAFPDVPGFKGQGWSTQETMLIVRWLFANPDAWDQAMDTARKYPGNPHTVADTLHEQIVPRSELTAIAGDGGDPARVNWLEIGHELIERRDDPRPAQEHAGIAGQAVGLAGDTAEAGQDADAIPDAVGIPVPDDPVAVSMFTAHRLDDTLRSLAHATERMQAARAASGKLRAYHCAHVAWHLQQALNNGHRLTENIREHYPAEAAELEQVKQAVGLAKALTPAVKAATTAHLLETTLHEETHGARHALVMLEPEPDDVWQFNADHCEKHLAGAVEHAGKLTQHFRDNYPAEARWLAGLEDISSGEEDGGGGGGKQQHARYSGGKAGTVTAQLANRGYDLNPRSGMISLDMPPGIITPVPGGVTDFHITVVYLGPDVDDEAFAQACLGAKSAAAAVPGPLTGMVGGIGTFPPSDGSDGKVPVWAGVVLPGADRLRGALEDLSASERPDWKPHVTLAYIDPGDPLPAPSPSMQVSFTHLSVHRGDDEVERFPLGGDPFAAEPVTINGQVPR